MLRNPSLAQIDYIADTLKTMGIERQYNLIERNQEHHHNSFPGRIPSENVCECVKNKYILAEAIHKEAKQNRVECGNANVNDLDGRGEQVFFEDSGYSCFLAEGRDLSWHLLHPYRPRCYTLH